MPYEFDFDLTKISRSFFRELAKFSEEKNVHKSVGSLVQESIDRFDLQERTGIPVSDSIKVVNDMIDLHAKNLANEEEYKKANKKALLLPHCARKHMDKNCEADFDSEYSSYDCNHCSEDCLINKATNLAEERGYDSYILPGGSCISKIIKKKDYDAILGVACSDEIKLGGKYLKKHGVIQRGVPLLKNGCSDTEFNMKTLKSMM